MIQNIKQHHIVVFQETHLRPTEHEVLPVIKDFSTFHVSRPGSSTFLRPGGGIAAYIHSSLAGHCKMLEAYCNTDILTIHCKYFILLSAYLPPINSTWISFLDEHPVDSFLRIVSALSASTQLPLVITGDWNARLANLLTEDAADPVVNVRGRQLHNVLVALNLEFLNGNTSRFGENANHLTCFQPMGISTVDYVVVNYAASSLLYGFAIGPHEPTWSDHAATLICLRLQNTSLDTASSRFTKKHITSEPKLPNESELDRLVIDLINSARDEDSQLLKLYSLVYMTSKEIKICIDAIAANSKTICVVYRSHNDPLNRLTTCPGPGINLNRAHLFSLLLSLKSAPRRSSLLIRTSSKYIVDAVSWLALKNSQTGWPVPNADMLKDILLLINWRLAPIRFQWVACISAESLPLAVQAARSLASKASLNSMPIKGIYCALIHSLYPAAKFYPTLSNQQTLIPIKIRKV